MIDVYIEINYWQTFAHARESPHCLRSVDRRGRVERPRPRRAAVIARTTDGRLRGLSGPRPIRPNRGASRGSEPKPAYRIGFRKEDCHGRRGSMGWPSRAVCVSRIPSRVLQMPQCFSQPAARALAAASPREGTSSFERIAETW